MTRILKAYDRSIFDLTPNFLVVTFHFAERFNEDNSDTNLGVREPNGDTEVDTKNDTELDTKVESLKKISQLILKQMEMNNHVTVNEIAIALSKSKSTILREVAKLKADGVIARVGSNYKGHWKILKGE
jgi:predicted HTH transcriptional regulator